MSKPTKRLGRGLDSLISNLVTDPPETSHAPAEAEEPKVVPNRGKSESRIGQGHAGSQGEHPPRAMTTVRLIAINKLTTNKYQPRANPDRSDIGELAESIRRSGILQPITARFRNGRYEIIAGERRWRAAREAGLTEVPVLVRDATDEEMLELALVENIQREDLNAIERAEAYRVFCDRFHLTAEEVARRLGEDRTTVVNYLRLLDLDVSIKAMLVEGRSAWVMPAACWA